MTIDRGTGRGAEQDAALDRLLARSRAGTTRRLAAELPLEDALRAVREAGQSWPAPVSPETPYLRVVLVDDHQLIREGLRRAFDRAGDIEVVGEAGSVAEAVDALERLNPDVLVTDVRLPDGDGIALTTKARAHNPTMGIVVLTMYAGDEQLFAALDAGASGFVGKDAPAEEVVAAARHAAASPRAFTARDLPAALQRKMSAPVGPRLSPREKEVLDLLVDGLAIAQIARRLFISESTAKTHVANIYEKLGAGNRAQAVMAAVRLGLVAPDLRGD